MLGNEIGVCFCMDGPGLVIFPRACWHDEMSECWTIATKMKKRLRQQKVCSTEGYWKYHGLTLIVRIRKRLDILRIYNKDKGLENLTLEGHIRGKRDREKQQVTYLRNLCIGMS